MKKNDQEITLLNSDNVSNKDIEKNNYKTTNVNILLNRVRLDKKRTFKKRFIFSIFLVTVISSLIVYFVI
ncbi:hypothetical protein [Candidatus Pelagibacter bacterium nBUS_28]|uniref:hypothetical protein n=1 Tax=Candidatus Pelagibacter bacterium nBUS_28 TaxID=3374189 RepID=UPI003EBF6F03